MKKSILLAVLGIVCFNLSACNNISSEKQVDTEYYDCEVGFTGVMGNKIYDSPDGYYFLMNNYLMFADKNLEQPVFVCNKAECLHNKETAENKVNCDAFFGRANSVRYYNGKVYVLALSLANQNNDSTSIYSLDVDGSNRKVIYSSKNDMESMIIHQGQVYIYEKKYTDESGNMVDSPVCTVSRFDLKKPDESEVIFESTDYPNADINDMKCYKDNLYFEVFGDSFNNFKIDLNSGNIEKCKYDFLKIGQDSLFCGNNIINNTEDLTWENEYFECDMNGNIKRKLTKEEFPILEENVTFDFVDDNYLYFQDIDYGGNMVPLEERKIHVCTYDGDMVGEIAYGNQGIEYLADFYPGNEKYLFFYVRDDTMNTCYYVEKDKIKNGTDFNLLYSIENSCQVIQ